MDPSATIDRDRLVEAVRREGAAVLDAAGRGLEAPVPTCGQWRVRDVLGHLGRVHRSVAEIIERRAQDIPDVAIPAAPEGQAVVGFFAEGLERVAAALASIGPDEPVFTWSATHRDGRFYHRRMAHELAVHRYDVQAAHGEPAGFEPDLAADGVDEYLEVVLPFALGRRPRTLPAGSIHLHRTDGPGEWLLEPGGDSVTLTREHAKGTVAVRGPASDLFAFVWHRGRSPALEVLGDEALADEWAALAP